jgi:hypothetical protein
MPEWVGSREKSIGGRLGRPHRFSVAATLQFSKTGNLSAASIRLCKKTVKRLHP